MDPSKELLLSKLLQPPSSSSKAGTLVQELGVSPDEILPPPPVQAPVAELSAPKKDDDEPTMFELMMAAQQEAAIEKKQVVEKETKAQETTFAKGFKKGFFGASKATKAPAASTKVAVTEQKKEKTDFDDDIIDLTGVTGKKSSSTSGSGNKSKVNLNISSSSSNSGNKGDADKFIFDDVQKALDEEQHPVLQQINKKEWVTPDLMSTLQSNKILAKGFRDPKCVAAMQMMQTDLKGAMLKFKDDEDVTLFLKEFGAAMAAHFEKLGEAQTAQQQQQQQGQGRSGQNAMGASASGPIIQEVGPLQAKALQRQKEQQAAAASTTTATVSSAKSASKAAAKQESEEERVQRILQDTELRSLLMDAGFQALLLECNDPVKYQQHMRNPETARKIRKLHESGLVKTTG